MNISVKVIRVNDAETIKELRRIDKQAFGDAGLDEWTLVPFLRHARVMALFSDDKIIGGAQFIRDWEDWNRAYLYGIAVDKDYRGKGLGTSFLKECMDILQEEGINVVELTVDPDNDVAVKVYEQKLDFKIVEKRENEYGVEENRLVMERSL